MTLYGLECNMILAARPRAPKSLFNLSFCVFFFFSFSGCFFFFFFRSLSVVLLLYLIRYILRESRAVDSAVVC